MIGFVMTASVPWYALLAGGIDLSLLCVFCEPMSGKVGLVGRASSVCLPLCNCLVNSDWKCAINGAECVTDAVVWLRLSSSCFVECGSLGSAVDAVSVVRVWGVAYILRRFHRD